MGGAVLEFLLKQARTEGFTSVYVSTTPDNTAVQTLMARIGVHLVPDGEELTACVNLAADDQ